MTMTSVASLFNQEELSYHKSTDGGVLIDDRWFAEDSTELERASYHTAFLRRQDRNRRRRERSMAQRTEAKPRRPHRGVSQAPESLEANRLPLERRKCLRRSTVAECPAVADVRTAWRYRNESEMCRLRLGALLMDLECYVDNSLVVIVTRGRRKIVGRNGGLKQWIRENCPELVPHYKTLQRIKGMAKELRQRIGLTDPVPLTVLLMKDVSEIDLGQEPVHVQPRDGDAEQVVDRFAWEKSAVHFDAEGRPYLQDRNYYSANYAICPEVRENLLGYAVLMRVAISLKSTVSRTFETYSAEGMRMGCEWSGNGGVESVGGLGKEVERMKTLVELKRTGVARKRKRVERMRTRVFSEMCGYVVRHPEFLVEVALAEFRELGTGLLDVMLPSRTVRRIQSGERFVALKLPFDCFCAYRRFIDEMGLGYTGWSGLWPYVPTSEIPD